MHRRVIDTQRHGAGQRDLVGPAECPHASVGDAQERPHETVLRSRREFHDEIHHPCEPLHRSQQLVRGIQSELVPALALGERQRISEADRSGGCRERRLDDKRPREVAARRLERSSRSDRPMAGGRVEQASKQRR
ncbi:MAG: hypothetical protein ABI611_23245 [Solirubrobacteraceae bacterium]